MNKKIEEKTWYFDEEMHVVESRKEKKVYKYKNFQYLLDEVNEFIKDDRIVEIISYINTAKFIDVDYGYDEECIKTVPTGMIRIAYLVNI